MPRKKNPPKNNKQNKQAPLGPRKIAIQSNPVRATTQKFNADLKFGWSKKKPQALNYIATDGLNASRVVTNTSVIEDRFPIRREKVCDITGSTSFANFKQLYLNPGNATLFPIFNNIAKCYDQYRCDYMVLTIESESYTASGTAQTAGIVCMATDVNPDSADFADLTEAENYFGSVKGPPYACVLAHDVLFAAKRDGKQSADWFAKNMYVNSSVNDIAPVGEAGKFFDMGKFQVLTANNVGNDVIGELYIEYAFTMIRPKQPTPTTNLTQQFLHAQSFAGSPSTFTAEMETVSNDGLTLVVNSGTTVTISGLEIGSTYLTWLIAHDGTTMTSLIGSTWASATTPFYFEAVGGPGTPTATVGTGSILSTPRSYLFRFVRPTATTSLVTFSGGSGITNAYVDWVIMKMPQEFASANERFARDRYNKLDVKSTLLSLLQEIEDLRRDRGLPTPRERKLPEIQVDEERVRRITVPFRESEYF